MSGFMLKVVDNSIKALPGGHAIAPMIMLRAPAVTDGVKGQIVVSGAGAIYSPLWDFEDIAAAQAVAIPAVITRVTTRHHTAAAKVGGASYKRVAAQPAHGLAWQDAAGAWFEFDEPELWAEQAGCKGGGVIDDSAALLAACDYCNRTHKPLRLQQVYGLSATLPVTSGWKMKGIGHGDATAVATQPVYPCGLKWIGAGNATTYMIDVKAAAYNDHVYGWSMEGVALIGQNNAGKGIRFSSTRYCAIRDCWIDRCRSRYVDADDSNGALNAALEIDGLTMVNGSSALTLNAWGLVFAGKITGCTGTDLGRVIGSGFRDGHGIVFGDIDNVTVRRCAATVNPGYAGLLLASTATTGDLRPPRKVEIHWWAGGLVKSEVGARNRVGNINSEGTSMEIAAGSTLRADIVDREGGRHYAGFAYKMEDHFPVQPQWWETRTVSSSPASPVRAYPTGAAVPSWSFVAGVVSELQCVIPVTQEIHLGRLLKLELSVSPGSPDGNPFKWRFGARYYAPGAGMGSAPTINEVDLVPAAANNGHEKVVLTFPTPVDVGVTGEGFILLVLGRGIDSQSGNARVISAALVKETNACSGDGAAYRFGLSDHDII